MPASTIERSAAQLATPARLAGSVDHVRTIGGVDAPAAGPWEIGSGQRIGLVAGGLRPQQLPARVLCGTLIVTDDLLGSALDFTMLVTDTRHRFDFSTRVSRLVSVDWWQADGTMATADGSRPVSLWLRYNGVFRQRGRQPSLWLTIQTTVDLPEQGVAVGSRRARRLKLAAELNLGPG